MAGNFYPHRPPDIELRQTHVSYVFLAGDYVYKIKKPVHLPFVDSSTLSKRRELCEREVLLNRRLAPDIYLGVVPILFRDQVFCLGQISKDDRIAVEFAVQMRRLGDELRLDNAAASRRTSAADIHALANRITGFHAAASRDQAWRYGAAAAVWQVVVGQYRRDGAIAR